MTKKKTFNRLISFLVVLYVCIRFFVKEGTLAGDVIRLGVYVVLGGYALYLSSSKEKDGLPAKVLGGSLIVIAVADFFL